MSPVKTTQEMIDIIKACSSEEELSDAIFSIKQQNKGSLPIDFNQKVYNTSWYKLLIAGLHY